MLRQLIGAIKWITVPRGVVLQQAGQPLHGLYFIKSGQIAVMASPDNPSQASGSHLSTSRSSSRAQKIRQLMLPMRQVAILSDNDYFGEDALTARGFHQVSRLFDHSMFEAGI